jgi:EAL and modified HD-GYP domain-containing signal transduction protein
MLINRQPVFDGKTSVQGYESQTQVKAARDPSRREMLNAVAENLDELAGNHWAMVTLPLDAIDTGAYEVLAADRTFVRVLGRSTDPSFQRSLSKLSTHGYRVAVVAPETDGLAPACAEIVSIHLDDARDDLPGRVGRLRAGRARIMVSGVDTYSDFDFCKAAGVDLFQGQFFCQAVPGRDELPVTRIPTMRLLTALQNPDVRLQDLEALVRNNLPLTYRLLSFTNSTYVGLSRPVESVKHAVGLVGLERIRKWASLLLYSMVEEKPRELFITAAVRARMCEQLADSDDEWRQSVFFTVGLLSVLDAVLDRPMIEVAETLPLNPEVREGLVRRHGILGATLQAVVDYETGDFDSIALRAFHPSLARNAYFEALHWARTVSSGLMI